VQGKVFFEYRYFSSTTRQQWGSLHRWLAKPDPDLKLLSAWPLARPPNWAKRVNEPLSEKEMAAVR